MRRKPLSGELTVIENKVLYDTSRAAAGLCKDIVQATARNIQGRKYVQVEGWQAIALAHGCTASAGDVARTETGFRAIAKITRMSDGLVFATAEGFVGDDEKMWASRPEYARRAMAQTRAISRACRSAFAHVVVMMNAGLETTPAEEIPDEPRDVTPPPQRNVKPEAEPDTTEEYVILDELGEEFWRGTDTKVVCGKIKELYQQCQSEAMLIACGTNNAKLISERFGTNAAQYARDAYKEQLSKLRKR
jgi:argininosuccinate synthase